MSQDLNFALLAADRASRLQIIRTWLVSDGSAKGINVAPGRFADPSGTVFNIPGVVPGEVVTVQVLAWGGDYSTFDEAANAQPGAGGRGEIFTMATGRSGASPPNLSNMPVLDVFGVARPISPLTVGIGWTNGLPQLSIVGTVGNCYALEFVSTLSGANPWQVLLGQTNWALINNPAFFVDSSAASVASRFYRMGPARTPPPSLVWISPGTFLMGSPTNETDREAKEDPQTQVTFTYGFWMGKYEVTQAEYQAVAGSNPSELIGDANRPVESVQWQEAQDYCARLTDQERVAGRLPAGYAYRLPTEGEWEYAARAGTTTRFSYGDDPGYTNLSSYAWYGENSRYGTHPVGQKQPNSGVCMTCMATSPNGVWIGFARIQVAA